MLIVFLYSSVKDEDLTGMKIADLDRIEDVSYSKIALAKLAFSGAL